MFLRPIYARLELLIKELSAVKESSSSSPGGHVDLNRVRKVQDALQEIESKKVHGGVFAAPNWDPATQPNAIPEGQAELAAMLEKAHDMVYDLLCTSADREGDGGGDQQQQHKDETVAHATGVLSSMVAALSSQAVAATHVALEDVEALAEQLRHSVEVLRAARSSTRAHLGRLVSRAYHKWNDYYLARSLAASTGGAATIMLDPKLADVEFELYNIRDGLKKLRNEVLFVRLAERNYARGVGGQGEGGEAGGEGATAPTPPTAPLTAAALDRELTDRLRGFRERLLRLESGKRDGRFVGDDGSFAPQGQALLQSIMEECFAIVYEVETVDAV